MIFIDGTWLYRGAPKLSAAYGPLLQTGKRYEIDFGLLPTVLANEVDKQLRAKGLDVVRTYLFGSVPKRVHPSDAESVERQSDFYDMLKEEYHYETEVFDIDFGGRHLRRADRDPKDPWEPREKSVDVALATSMLYFAAIPYAYDVAIAVLGDQDFVPVLQHVRRLGKRVAIASVKSQCAFELLDPEDHSRVKDFDVIWIDDLLDVLELKYQAQQLECQSPGHVGDRRVWSDYRLRKGRKFFCPQCRATEAHRRSDVEARVLSMAGTTGLAVPGTIGQQLIGSVARKIDPAKGRYGWIFAVDGNDYFFHAAEVRDGSTFEQLAVGTAVQFEVSKIDPDGKRAARDVRPAQPAEVTGTPAAPSTESVVAATGADATSEPRD